ncbi:MAG: hypothetical protein ACI9XZ_000258 [Alphaproteobacteria bacterium]
MSIRALRFDRIAEMLEFLAIFGAAIGGFAGMPPWVIAASAIALASLSYAENYKLYRRGQELGLTDGSRPIRWCNSAGQVRRNVVRTVSQRLGPPVLMHHHG